MDVLSCVFEAGVYENYAVWAVMCAGSSSLAAEVNSHDFTLNRDVMMTGVEHRAVINFSTSLEDTFGSEGLKADMNRKKMLLAVMGLEAGMNRKANIWISTAVTKLLKKGLSCSEGKEEDFNKESLLQLSSLNKLVTEKKFSSCVLTVATSWADVSNVARARLWTEEDCQQRDWIQNTNFTAGRVFSTTRRVRFTTRRAVTTRRLCGNNTTKNSTARRAVTARRLNMQHNTKNANIQTLMWTPSSQYIRVAYSCDKTVGPSHR
ncbi:hypothetical protein DPMN_125807 [Dreissena polymorpha]|uniref:Uncharacterized protein n=1 Tax=Dreissena polymorpha TaxID=45954 RepID=A0A9D4GYE5_DREPO|nr:hypothetical protein DPMN_125807 [Dreissena polymorpha]